MAQNLPADVTRPIGAAEPVPVHQRLAVLDILRGIALLGVLVSNVWLWFSGTWFRFPTYLHELRLPPWSADGVVYHAIAVLVSGKAIATFSFLFGLGFAVQLLRAEEKGAQIVPLYLRRLFVLLAIGVVHCFFLWYGDILHTYAVLGFALLLFRNRSDRFVIGSGLVLLFVVPLAFVVYQVVAPGAQPPVGQMRAAALAAFQSGDPTRVMGANLQLWQYFQLRPEVIPFLAARLGFFLLGFWAGRAGVFRDVARFRGLLLPIVRVGIPVGLTLMVASTAIVNVAMPAPGGTPPVWYGPARAGLNALGIPALAFGYVAAATLLIHAGRFRRLFGAFAPVGRMALSNYLSQTLICLALFYGYGGWIGRIGPAAALSVSLVVFAAQVVWSPLWLARYQFGPAEWAWRSLVYRRLQPMRIVPQDPIPLRPAVGG